MYVGTLDDGLYKIDLNEKVSFYDNIKDNIAIQNNKGKDYFLTQNELIIAPQGINKIITKEEFYTKINSFFSKENLIKHPKRNRHRFINDQLKDLEFLSIKVFNEVVWINTTIGLFKISNQDFKLNYYAIYTGEFFIQENNSAYFQSPYEGVNFINNLMQLNKIDIYGKELINTPKNTRSIQKIENTLFFMSEYTGLYTLENGKFISYLNDNTWKEKELIKATTNQQNQLIVANSKSDVFILDVLDDFNIAKKISNNQIKGNTINTLNTYKDYIVIGTEKGLNFYKDNTNILIDQHLGVTDKILSSVIIENDTLTAVSENGYYKIDLKK